MRDLLKAILPDLKNIELIIDRIHRLPKPAFLSESVPRDVILRFHFYHVKEQLIHKARALGTLPDPYSHLQLFTDLSQHTLSRRRQLNTITKALRNHNIQYQWIAPAKLAITYNGSKHVTSSLQDGLRLLQGWNILPDYSSEMPMEHSQSSTPH